MSEEKNVLFIAVFEIEPKDREDFAEKLSFENPIFKSRSLKNVFCDGVLTLSEERKPKFS